MFQVFDNSKATSAKVDSNHFNDISLLRVSAMLMVVFYHCLCPYSIWDGSDYFIGFHVQTWDVVAGMLSQVHLPIFFLISGYLFAYKRNMGGYDDNIKFVKDKAARVLIPYCVIGLSLCILQNRDVGQMLNGISHLWFLLAIFECYILGKAIEGVLLIPERKRQVLMVMLLLFLILVPYRIPEVRFLCLSRIVTYFPYYLIGMLASKIDFGTLTKYKSKVLGLILMLMLLFVFQQIYVKRGIVTATFGVYLVLLSFTYVRLLNIPKLHSWMISLDKCSMGIYIVHHILIQELITISVFRSLATEYCYIFPCVLFISVTIISWGIVWSAKKNKYSKYIIG